ncbi:DeoR/GlpR family DNA-binding transcription regulator [Asaia astilbis]|uniref:DeoR/GlpR family DNA-binding transcription regulator n=1 Tax=Asaia astilbis TaxID=610244 RepID=UPI000A464AC2|nr:DeoR/GlpR family DNA-binding transcription regulator [Asaia astilbis]
MKRQNLKSRQQQILDLLFEQGNASIEFLAEHFDVSRMTIHRDAHALAGQGLIDKIHGGITLKNRARTEKNVAYRQHRAANLKRAIIQRAVSMIEPGQVIILDDSTTVAEMLPLLPALAPLTVITNGVGVVQALAPFPGIKIICLGGDYSNSRNAFFGLVCEQAARSLRANLMFMSTSVISGDTAFQNDQDVVKVKRALMAIADDSVLLVDSTKFRQGGLHRLTTLSEFTRILTDNQITPSTVAELEASGVAIEVC